MKHEIAAAILLAFASPLVRAAGFDDGLRLMSEKKYPEAVSALELESRLNPGSPEVMLNLGWAYWHAKRVDDAWRIGATLVKLDPQNRAFQIFLANTEIERKEYAKSAERMKAVLKSAPEDHDAKMVLARALFMSGKESEALILLDGILARSPDDAPAAYRRAAFLSDTGKKKEALATLDRLLASDPENLAYRRSRAKILLDLGREPEAKTEWRNLTRTSPDAQSLMNLGWLYWKDKDYDAAWKIAVILVKLDDKNPVFLRFMANMQIERLNYSEALIIAQQALTLDPGDRDAALTLAKAYFRMQREKDAMAVLEKLISRYPDNPVVRYRWAEFLGRTGRYDESLEYFDRLIKTDPANEAYRMNRAMVLYEMGRFDAAVAEWNGLAAQKTPNSAALRLLRDDAYNRRDWEAAADWQKRIISEAPSDPLGWEKLSKIYTAQKNMFLALRAAEQGIEADPISINDYYLQAQTLEQMQDWPAAKKAYEDIVARNKNSIRAYDGLAYVLEAQGDYKGSMKILDRIDELTSPSVSPYLEVRRARLLSERGRFNWAIKILRRLEEDRRTAIPVLLYHGISPFDRSDSIPAESLRRQLTLLKKLGYHSLTVTELDRIFQAKANLPEKPLVITFDDARTDSFENADPILKETGFKATMFVHVSRLRKPHFHAAPEDIAKWQATGRWDMQAHGYEAHDPMPLDAFGRKGHFLPNRKWLVESNRLETLEEYRTRVAGDYEKAKQGVQEIVPGHRVVAFAYPYGDYGQNDYSNTPESAEINQALVRKNFHLAFVQEQYGINTLSSNPTDLRRYEVPRNMTAEQLAAHLTLSDPGVQARLLEAQLWIRADQAGRAEAIYAKLKAEGVNEPQVWADEGAAYMKAGDIAYARNLFAKALAAEPDQDGPAGELDRRLVEQSERAAAPAVAAEGQAFSDSDTNAITKVLLRGSAMVKSARLSAWVGQTRYADDREPGANASAVRGREAGVEARGFATRRLELDGFYARRVFDQGFTGSADNYALSAAYRAAPSLRLTARDGMNNVETAAAVRTGRKLHTDGAGLEWDPALNWKTNVDYDETWYNDANSEGDLRLRLTKRFSEHVALGAAYFHGDSTARRSEYYTPRRLNQVTGVLTLNQSFGAVNQRTGLAPADGLIQYEGGYGFQPDGSRAVQAVRAAATVRPWERVSLSVSGQYSQSPTYVSRRVDGIVSVSF
jgi:tetratricopeptide (TPR) repeat protein